MNEYPVPRVHTRFTHQIEELLDPHEIPSLYFPVLRDLDSNPFLLLDDVFTDVELDTLVAAVKKELADGNSHKRMVATRDGGFALDTAIFDTTEVKPQSIEAVMCIKNGIINRAIREHWDFNDTLGYPNTWAGMAYEVGGHYISHSDNSIMEPPYTMIFPSIFSTVLYLNDWSHDLKDGGDFEGGELVFTHLVDRVSNSRPTVYPKRGLLAIFPSNTIFRHKVNPVRAGIRLSLANWMARGRDVHLMSKNPGIRPEDLA